MATQVPFEGPVKLITKADGKIIIESSVKEVMSYLENQDPKDYEKLYIELPNYFEPYRIWVETFMKVFINSPVVAIKEKVNHPAHYNKGKYEVIKVIEDWDLGFHLGNVIKYVARAEHKDNNVEDLEKALWYLNRKIQILKGEVEE